MKEIVGIGSCLSERVARQFGNKFGGQTISMVRHNRSDQLVPIMTGSAPPDLAALTTILDKFPNSDPTNSEFIFGQSKEGIGRSTNLNNIDFCAAMTRPDVELVLIDNFMDLTADLWKTDDGTIFFSRFPKDCPLQRIKRLSPAEAAQNYKIIAERSTQIWPNAAVLFLHFPFSNYPEDSSRREWGASFFSTLRLPSSIDIVPPRDIPVELLRNGQPHHYHHSVYGQIAEEIHEMLIGRKNGV